MTDTANLIDKLVDFVKEIGIDVVFGEVPAEKEFVPGLYINKCCLTINMDKLKYPGDILHEAAHIAVATQVDREQMDGVLETGTDKSAGEEIMCIAWSYAAALHLNIDPYIVFHEDGYKGDSKNIVENFSEGRTIGVPLLEWIGLCASKQNAEKKGVLPYPHMIKWMR